MRSRGTNRRLLLIARRIVSLGLVCTLALIGASTLAVAASSTASAGKLSARLAKTNFTGSQAGSVKLTYKFSKPSKRFSYLLTFKQGKKWKTVKSVKKKGNFKGSKTTTVKKIFAGKPIKLGSYRLKLSADTSSKLLSFRVVPAASPTVKIAPVDGGDTSGVNFTITGGAEDLEPGQTKPIGLTLTNPNSVQIFVTQLVMTVSADSTPAGCASASNLQITQSNASIASPIAVPASGSVTLTSAPLAPQITFLNLPDANQDACKNVSFALTYSGSAHS
jgi:hypothetical protein